MAAAALRAQSRLQEIHVEEVLPRRTSRNATVEFQRMVAQQDFLRTLVLQKDVCRGISLRTALRVSEHKAREAWESSRSVGAFDVFISHSWKSEKRLRHGSLLLQSGWMEMVIAWSIAAILSFFLSIFDLLPLFWSYEAEAFQEEYQCFLGCWILAFSMLAAMWLGAQIRGSIRSGWPCWHHPTCPKSTRSAAFWTSQAFARKEICGREVWSPLRASCSSRSSSECGTLPKSPRAYGVARPHHFNSSLHFFILYTILFILFIYTLIR